jgi:hypothetical protein
MSQNSMACYRNRFTFFPALLNKLHILESKMHRTVLGPKMNGIRVVYELHNAESYDLCRFNIVTG